MLLFKSSIGCPKDILNLVNLLPCMPTAKKRVIVFGTFDVVHEGHRSLFRQAKAYGDELIVVVAKDETVKAVKGNLPHFNEETRLAAVEKETLVNRAVLGNPDDKYAVIEKLKPDIICLGYDQHTFIDQLPEELESRGLSPKIVRLEAFKPEQFKSSKIKAHLTKKGRRPHSNHFSR